jgi:hypothetical protein
MTPEKFAKLVAFIKQLAIEHNKLEQRLEALEEKAGAVIGKAAPVSPKPASPEGRSQFDITELD